MLRHTYEGGTCALKVKEWFLQMNACCLVILAVDSSVCMVVFFCLLIFALFHGDCVNMLGIDWVNHVVLDGGCIGLKGKFVRGLASEYATRKLIVNCIFDIVNTKTPSGGMIGPGNCQWLHNTLLFISGAIGPGTQKLLKNHAAVHDACGFVLTHTDIRSGFGYSPKMQ